MRRAAALGTALVLLLTAAACTGDDDGPTTTTTDTSAPSTTTTEPDGGPPPIGTPQSLGEGDLGGLVLSTEEVGAVEGAVAFASRPSSTDLYVAAQAGTVHVIEVDEDLVSGDVDHELQDTPVLDLRGEVLAGGERGLLGLAFSSDGRKLYLDYTAKPDGRTVIVEYDLGDGDDVDLGSRRELLTIEQPFPNHNGGQLATGPDGYLYIAMGDGGDGGDPQENAQAPDQLLGKLLRIDPAGANEDRPYGIPPGNPFVDVDDARPEIWVTGVRNPWRFSFDRETGDLWVADVGQGEWEEVDLLPATQGFDAGKGANLGWDDMEGSHPFEGDGNPSGATLPLFEYDHSQGGCAVIGGFVYRGADIPGLAGRYLFADSCRTGVEVLGLADGGVTAYRRLELPLSGITSFGEDRDGELYVLAGGVVHRLQGAPDPEDGGNG